MPRLRLCVGIGVMSWPSSMMAPAGRLLEAGDHPQQRGLAAAGRAEQADEGAVRHAEVDVVDGLEVAELLGDVLDCQSGHGASLILARTAGSRLGYRLAGSLPSLLAATCWQRQGAPGSPRFLAPRSAGAARAWACESETVRGRIASRSPDDQLGPLLVQPIRLRRIEVVARDDRLDLGRQRLRIPPASGRALPSSASAPCRPCATSGPGCAGWLI